MAKSERKDAFDPDPIGSFAPLTEADIVARVVDGWLTEEQASYLRGDRRKPPPTKPPPRYSTWHHRTLGELDNEVLAGRMTPAEALRIQNTHRVMQPQVRPPGFNYTDCVMVDPVAFALQGEQWGERARVAPAARWVRQRATQAWHAPGLNLPSAWRTQCGRVVQECWPTDVVAFGSPLGAIGDGRVCQKCAAAISGSPSAKGVSK